MLSFVFILCLRMGDVTFVKFLYLTDLVTGQDGLQLMSPLSTVKSSILVNRTSTGIFCIIGGLSKGDCRSNRRHLVQYPCGKGNGDSHFFMNLSSSCGDVHLS